MKTIARFAIDKRWYVIAGWIAFVALTQVILGGLGGSAYKDTFSLPGTETDKVMHLLDQTGHADQNGPSWPGCPAREVGDTGDGAGWGLRRLRGPVLAAPSGWSP
jgi:RND superfamily putative drug exporter